MKDIIRLDKFLCDMGIGTRSEVKNYIKNGRITFNGEIIKTPDKKVNVTQDEVFLDRHSISYSQYEYYMLNKPSGVVSARIDNVNKTVIELITISKRKDLFPVGRLDKDTEGLLFITNDGELAHQLLSPKKQIGKKYYAKIKGIATMEDVTVFQEGIRLEEDFLTLPAKLEILQAGDISEIEVTIYEGKFHQVKRMFLHVGKEVIYLKRISMGNLILDPNLQNGEYRPLTKDEINFLKMK